MRVETSGQVTRRWQCRTTGALLIQTARLPAMALVSVLVLCGCRGDAEPTQIEHGADQSPERRLEEPAGATTDESSDVAVIVNGEPIHADTIAAYQRNILRYAPNEEPVSEEEACLQAVDWAVRSAVLAPESARRGNTASEAEAAEAVATLLASATDEPMIREFLDEQQQRLGVTDEENEAKLKEVFLEQIVEKKAVEQLADGAPVPEATEVDGYLDSNPPGMLVLMALQFDDSARADQVYEELFDELANPREPGSFAKAFIAYGKQLGVYSQDVIDVTESFAYTDSGDLPDYARAATGVREGSLSIVVRDDDTGAVVYVLVNRQPGDSLRENVEESLTQRKRHDHVQSSVDILVEQAEVQLLIDCSEFR